MYFVMGAQPRRDTCFNQKKVVRLSDSVQHEHGSKPHKQR